ncbi:hypothetical protein C8J56DRAFT_801211, partial [Mycena floridula]
LGFFVTTFKLQIPQGLDVPMSAITFTEPLGMSSRVYLFVNGVPMFLFSSAHSNIRKQTLSKVPCSPRDTGLQ